METKKRKIMVRKKTTKKKMTSTNDKEDRIHRDSDDSDLHSGDDGKGRKNKRGRRDERSANDLAQEDTYEDEDPFTPDIDIILTDK
jgi:hypothetical protein